MDRNSIIGIVVICVIMFVWMWYSAPSKEELLKQKRIKDSLELAEKQKPVKDTASRHPDGYRESADSSITNEKQPATNNGQLTNLDSAKTVALADKYDVFASAANDSSRFFTLENARLKVTIANKGGRICSVLLKEYRTYDSLPLALFDNDSSSFGLLFDTENNRTINTGELYFSAVEPQTSNASSRYSSGQEPQTFSMRLYAGADSTGKSDRYIEYEYSLADDHILKCKLNFVGLEKIVANNLSEFSLYWKMKTPAQEKDIKSQQQNSTIYFKYMDESPDYLSEMSDETKTLVAKTKWVAFKQQFFTSVIIADNYFDKAGAEISSINEKSSSKYVKNFSTTLTLPYSHQSQESFSMQFYFGPNHFQTLKKYDLALEKQIPLGWGIFGWVNRFLVIPVFNFLDSFNLNYGIIILCLTLVFKTLLFPVAWKTYISSAKMRVLKPEIDEINTKFKKEDAMKKQQAIMSLYRRAGVSPLAGCLPALLQMPILIALFRFFPASIELRQQGFWWATDLSTYDSIWDFGKIPVIDFIYGDHVSVWALLCTITTLVYTHLNSQMMSGTSSQQMPGMKYMLYFMPVMFLPFLNQFSAGLSYYYTLANLISFGQMYVIRKYMVDEKKLHAQIEENKKKPAKPLSSFQQRLQKKLGQMQKQKNGQRRQKVK